MIIRLYSVYDITAATFSEPFSAVNDDVAKRNFRFTMARYNDYFVRDMELYCIGDFCSESGDMRSLHRLFIDSGEKILADKESEEALSNEEKENEK